MRNVYLLINFGDFVDGKDGKTTPASLAVVTGGDGTTVTKTDGTTFTYKNAFGGYCECGRGVADDSRPDVEGAPQGIMIPMRPT